jgi:hypothetical protein
VHFTQPAHQWSSETVSAARAERVVAEALKQTEKTLGKVLAEGHSAKVVASSGASEAAPAKATAAPTVNALAAADAHPVARRTTGVTAPALTAG